MNNEPDVDALGKLLTKAEQDYAELRGRQLSLDLTRGKPSPEQLDLAAELLELPGAGKHTAADGSDCRNYGGLAGLPELREIFTGILQVPLPQLLAAGNSSLELMHDCLVHALLSVVPGGESRWADHDRIVFLCPVPGYDRHFALCERFGIDMIPVPMGSEGPDMDVVERLVAEDPTIKGIWCVPKYSNPDGTCYSDATVHRLARMQTAAPDFRIFWDNAYAVHHLTDDNLQIVDILTACLDADNTDRPFIFGSTSKITLAGSGVAFFGSSTPNVSWFLGNSAKRSIGPDKINQLRHAIFLVNEAGVQRHMTRHRASLQPKFDTVQRVLHDELDGTGLAQWTVPKGGYFVLLEVGEGDATAVVQRAGQAGIALTHAGATHPNGLDPRDAYIRIAPSYPSLQDLEQALHGLATCVRLVSYERQIAKLSTTVP